MLRSSASTSHLYTNSDRRQADERQRRSADHLNVFNPNVRLTLSNPNIPAPSTAAAEVCTVVVLGLVKFFNYNFVTSHAVLVDLTEIVVSYMYFASLRENISSLMLSAVCVGGVN